jgi:hypothetical protein
MTFMSHTTVELTIIRSTGTGPVGAVWMEMRTPLAANHRRHRHGAGGGVERRASYALLKWELAFTPPQLFPDHGNDLGDRR